MHGNIFDTLIHNMTKNKQTDLKRLKKMMTAKCWCSFNTILFDLWCKYILYCQCYVESSISFAADNTNTLSYGSNNNCYFLITCFNWDLYEKLFLTKENFETSKLVKVLWCNKTSTTTGIERCFPWSKIMNLSESLSNI